MTQCNLLSSRQTSRDENLEAKLPGGGGRVKEERKRERLSERPVVSLTRPTTPYNQRGFHRVARRQAEWPAILQSLIGKSEIGQSLVGEFTTLPRMRTSGFGLWSASGESGAEGGEQRLAERSRSATPPPGHRRKPAACCGNLPMPARDERIFCEAEQARSQGETGRPSSL